MITGPTSAGQEAIAFAIQQQTEALRQLFSKRPEISLDTLIATRAILGRLAKAANAYIDNPGSEPREELRNIIEEAHDLVS